MSAAPLERHTPVSPFRHLHAAHCETGVTAALLRHAGLEVSEPLVFGIGSGVFFFRVPVVRVQGMPIVTYRTYPGAIFAKACRRLGVRYRSERFFRRSSGVDALDFAVDAGIPVGLQASMAWLDYFPAAFRHAFNGHNLVVTGRTADAYGVSDPMLPEPVRIGRDALTRARFARGPLSPRGRMYRPTSVPERYDLRRAVRAGLRDTCDTMLRIPVPFGGVKGIRHLARKVRRWPETLGSADRVKLQAGHLIRMQEEVGTGGAGFRYMFAAFLEEAGLALDDAALVEASESATSIGDDWREFAVLCARVIKERRNVTCDDLAEALEALAGRERALFSFLRRHLPDARPR